MDVQRKSINVQVDPLSLTAGIQVLSGNPLQSYNKDTDEYEDDRTLVPLIIMPWVSIVDPHNIMPKGLVTLTSVTYYNGTPNAGVQIVNGDDYVISDAGTPVGSLKVKKNVPVNSPMEIYAVFLFTDLRTNQSVAVERSISLRTTFYDSRNYSVKIDQPKGFTVDPTRTTKAEDGSWPVVLNAQMYSGKELVPDTNAAYFWYVLDGSSYRLIDNTELDLWMNTDRNANGTWPKQITIDARLFKSATIRCMAAYYSGTVPTSPASESIQATTTIKVQLPPTAYAKMIITKGLPVTPGQNNPIEARCEVYDNAGIIANPSQYYRIIWYKVAQTLGATPVEIGYGDTLTTTPQALGITATAGYNIYPKVDELREFNILTDSDGAILTDLDGAILISQ